jgi:hypothetical protein
MWLPLTSSPPRLARRRPVRIPNNDPLPFVPYAVSPNRGSAGRSS